MIDDKYIYCQACIISFKGDNKQQDSLKILEQMNWNLGMISKTLQALLPKDKLDEIKKQMKR